MSSSEAHAAHNPHLAHHFDSMEQQNHAARLGMWLFLATEVLLFGGLFLGYTVYRWMYPQTYQACANLLSIPMGATNTVVLITSSFTAAWAYHAVRFNQIKKGLVLLTVTMLFACAFLVIKYFEYRHKFEVGELPGKWYTYEGLQSPGANLFFAVYFLATGLHGLHVVIGMTVLGIIGYRVYKGRYNSSNYVAVELGVLYWHLVDLVWIFLFPLLYLI